MGSVLLAVAVLPVFEVLPLPETWQTTMVASKLLLMPLGAVLLFWGVGLQTRRRR